MNNWILEEKANNMEYDLKYENKELTVSLKKSLFSLAEVCKKKENAIENGMYKYSSDILCENAEVKEVFTCIGEDGAELSRGYLLNGKTIATPEGTVAIKISVICYAKNQNGTVKIKNADLEYLSEYKERKVTVAAIAVDYDNDVPRTHEKNLSQNLEKIDKAMTEKKADIIVLSECFYSRNVPLSEWENAITIDSEPVKALRNKAKEYGAYIVCSIREIADDRLYNTGLLIGRTGEIEGIYRKTHLTLCEYEEGIVPGDDFPVFETDFGKIGIAICWDLFFPEWAKTYHINGAELICYPTAGFEERRISVRASDNGCYIAVSAVHEREETRIVGPDGEPVSIADEKGYAIAQIDLNKPQYLYWLSCPSNAERKDMYLNERRPELYKKFNK